MKLIRQLAVATQKNRSVVMAGKLTALALVAAMAGCASRPVPKNTLGSQIRGLAIAIQKNPYGDISNISSENYAEAMTGIYQENKGYYASDTGFRVNGSMGDNFIPYYSKAIEEMCRRKGAEFYTPFCQKGDSAEEVIFFAKVSNSQMNESLFSWSEYNGPPKMGNEILIYEKTVENSPEFVKIIKEKLGYKTNAEKKVEEEASKKAAEERKLQNYRSEYAAVMQEKNSIVKISKFLRDYSGKFDPDNVINAAELRLAEMKKSIELDSYRKKYSAAVNSIDFKEFINVYEKNDPDGLVTQARVKLKVAEANEAKQRQLEEQERQRRQEAQRKEEAAKQAKLEAWRKSIKVGDDTFCGPVIEVRQPMVRISIKVPLSGYPSETWLKSSELYPDWMAGCRNVNGQIRPMF